MTTISTLVQISDIVAFTRHNDHSNRDENFLAITMIADDNPMIDCPLVNFTREDTSFAVAAMDSRCGEVFRLAAQDKGVRCDEGHESKLIVTHCIKGGFKGKTAAQRKAARIAKMNKKLGITSSCHENQLT